MTTHVITKNSTVQNATADEVFTGTFCGRMEENAPTTVYNDSVLEIAKASTGNFANSHIKFDISRIPSKATISSAVFYLYMHASLGAGNHTIEAFRLLRDWQVLEVTWNEWTTGNSWTTGGATGNGTDRASSSTASETVPNTTGVYYQWDVTSDVQAFHRGSLANYGWMLERTDGSLDSAYRRFQPPAATTDGQRPELVVVYSLPVPPPASQFVRR